MIYLYSLIYQKMIFLNLTLRTHTHDSHLPKSWFYLRQEKALKNDEKCFLSHAKTSFHSQDI